ncbi:unnamed protein product [Anisakis simplex]|uniref:Kinesin-like protein n=1 Tax=Anisakis simplex TaxID=6269 RepID=A0A0M3JXR7_ANISI|nr:unnamed protein product [Anisakis simplex]
MERVNVGMHVDIRRSDGRVHNAVISEVRKESSSVTVEWFENVHSYLFVQLILKIMPSFSLWIVDILKGETKGKEIDLKALLAINPTLAAPPPSTPIANTFSNDENRITSSYVNLRHNANNTNAGMSLSIKTKFNGRRSYTVAPSNVGISNGIGATSNGNYVDSSVLETLSEENTTFAPSTPHQPQSNARAVARNTTAISQPSKMPPRKNRFTLDPSNFNVDDIAGPIRMLSTPCITTTPALDNIPSSISATSTVGVMHQISNKSSTVQEIERLQRNREERRAHQVVVKKQKEQLKNLDPGNPNWQFLTMIREYQSMIDFRPLKITDQVAENRITVCVRKRPLNRKEIMKKEIEVITIPNRDHVIVHQPQVKLDLTKYLDNQKFRFDYTFDENSSNEMIYRFTAQPLLKTVFGQGFATCFAYGQTGSGKTHTMGGNFTGKTQDCSKGIYALTASDVFKTLNTDYKKDNLQVGCSFFEIYGGKVFDLIANKSMLKVLEDGKGQVQIVGLQEVIVNNEQDVLDIIQKGTDIRTAGTTSANQNSSRSHAVFQIILRKKPPRNARSSPGRLWGKFSLIDLAGNERGVDTISSDRQTRMEGAEINKSLLALKECIRAMGRNSSHVPFRTSKLTLVLRDSFIGSNAKTCMIAMISPGMCSCEHTLNTLRYADRVKELGAEDGASTPMEDEELMLGNIGDDLDILSTSNDMTEAAYRRQKALQDIAIAEEKVLDALDSVCEGIDQRGAELKSLRNRSSKVDYDMDAFVSDLLRVADEGYNKYCRLHGAVLLLHTSE